MGSYLLPFLNFSLCSSPVFHTFCVFTPLDGFLCDSFVQIPFKMVGTRSGINTTIPPKKEKTAMKAKDVKSKGPGLESYRHGVRVRGLRSNKRADGQAGGAITGSIPPENPSLSAARSVTLEKASLSIIVITGEVSFSRSSEEEEEEEKRACEEGFLN